MKILKIVITSLKLKHISVHETASVDAYDSFEIP